MLKEEHMENENLQEKSQCDEREEPHGIGESVDGHNDVVNNVVHSMAEHQEEIETLVITNENTEEIFSQEEVTLCITCSKDESKCILCQNTAIIEETRHDASRGQKRAAKKMLANIGSCVLLPIDKIDRGPSDMQNLMCVVTDYKNGVYQVGCVAGRIKS
ncbi:unnamed protein product [Psylliodes chrysocephalus]|uniref:Uncharacterized protein n=1 Tax=Psylliodes chrysocephalus TaxID=3402493 RepID=A0A9P0G2V3_9CUCU|nr:unnamed protein product [Psylliodes chrysocephala]